MRPSVDDMPLSGILAAVYYLSQEAERAGRHDVKSVLRSTIVAIDALAKTKGGPDDIASPTTCAVLEFFDQFVQASPAARADFLEMMRAEATGT